MLVASDNINGIGEYQWEKAGDAGAIEVPDYVGSDLINRGDGHYWAVDGTKPQPKVKPEAAPEVPLEEDASTGNDVEEAIEAASVGPKKATRTRKSATTKE